MEHQPAGNIRTLVKDIEMTRGRHKDSREQLMLRGTLRKDRDRPNSTIGTPIKLEEIGQKCQVSGLQGANQRTRRIYWAAVKRVAALGMMQETFCQNLFMMALEYDMMLRCQDSIEKDGMYMVVEGKKGTFVVQNPSVKQLHACVDRILKIGSMYGFSPADVQKIKLQAEDPKATGIKAIFERLTVLDESPEEQ